MNENKTVVSEEQLQMFKKKLQKMQELLMPEFPDGDSTLVKGITHDPQLREGNDILYDSMLPTDATLVDFVDSLIRMIKYFLLSMETQERKNYLLRREVRKYRELLYGEKWEDDIDLWELFF